MMGLVAKVIGLTVAGVGLIALYLSISTSGALMGAVAQPSPATSPLGVVVYLGLALTAVCLVLVMMIATSGGGSEGG